MTQCMSGLKFSPIASLKSRLFKFDTILIIARGAQAKHHYSMQILEFLGVFDM